MAESERTTAAAAEDGARRFPPGGGMPLQLEYEVPHPVGQSTLGPPGAVSKALWWMSYRVGRAMGRVLVKPRGRRAQED